MDKHRWDNALSVFIKKKYNFKNQSVSICVSINIVHKDNEQTKPHQKKPEIFFFRRYLCLLYDRYDRRLYRALCLGLKGYSAPNRCFKRAAKPAFLLDPIKVRGPYGKAQKQKKNHQYFYTPAYAYGLADYPYSVFL